MDSYTRAAINAPRPASRPALATRLADAAMVTAAIAFTAWHWVDVARWAMSLVR